MTILEIQGYVMIFLEALVVSILIMEYIYDRNLNEHVKQMKRRAKKRYEFECLTLGEHR